MKVSTLAKITASVAAAKGMAQKALAASPNPQWTEYEIQSVDEWIASQGLKIRSFRSHPPAGRAGVEGEEMTARAENSGKLWTSQEDERLRELAVSGANPSEIAAKLNRTEAATKARAYVLRLALGRLRARRAEGEGGNRARCRPEP
jgi:hypothetical protein